MATKQAAPQFYETAEAVDSHAEAVRRERTTAVFEIEGLTALYNDGSGKQKFELAGVPMIDINWPALTEGLISDGVDRQTAEEAIEEFAPLLESKLLAKVLAKRMKRVG